MKKMKKLVSLLIAAVMVLAVALPVAAEETTGGTITITNATVGNTYKVYKVFDAAGNGTNISYKLVEGKTTAPAGFTVDGAGNVTYSGSGENGNLTADDIAEIAKYVTENDKVSQVEAGEKTVTISNLPNGYYYITTTTGTAVTITSTNPSVVVVDKNEAPELNKKITNVTAGSKDSDGANAIAQAGSTVVFTATIDVKNGAQNYVFHDVMDSGLSYLAETLSVKVDGEEVNQSNYNTATAEGDTITINFNNEWIKGQIGKTITITYSATVASDALTAEAPATNKASVDYGVENTISSDVVKVYNATITVTKKDGDNNPLAGAGFVLKNSDNKYYKIEGKTVRWVEDIDSATELTTTDVEGGNIVFFTGLADGTYTLIENTVPAGYNRAQDESFTINSNDYTNTNLAKNTTVVNEAGSVLPSTGGMGTTIFYVIGMILVIGAGVVLVTRKRMHV